MTEVPVKNLRGEVVGSVDLDDRVFGIEPNRAVLHQAVVTQLANHRKGTHNTKTRGEVAGGTHKMWRQKGTGRARQGDNRAPHWRGGGVVFGPHPRSYHKDMPKKMRRLAMRSALSARLAEQALTVVDELLIPSPKTREMVGVLRTLGLQDGALIVMAERDETIARASANLEKVRAVTPGGLCLLDVLNFHHLLFTRSAAEAMTQLVLEGGGRRARSGPRGLDSGMEEVTGDATDVTTAQASGVTPGTPVEPVTAAPDEPDVRMDDAALASDASQDVALADAAEQVARPDDKEDA